MYQSVLASDGVADAPRLLGSGRNPDGGRWLLMEWAGSMDLSQVGARAVWCHAAARLAGLHVWGESRVEALSRGALVRWDDPLLHLQWARRARASLAEYFRAQGAVDPLASLWRRYRVVAARLARMPKTLVHGDFNASNILVTRFRGGSRIRIIDWETAGIGPGLLDLASLVSGRVPERRRAAIVAAYRANIACSRIGGLSEREFDEALTWCRLALAVQWIGWSPGWSPPRAHAYDWRAEALTLAQQLGLLDRT
jgi:Ser/Thr protein kinase RdoA (MazF antagonist)